MSARQTKRPAGGLFPLLAFFIASVLCILAVSRSARGYAWMIRYGYNNCASCHADPSGGGLLTEYGRAQSDLILRSHYDGNGDDELREPHPSYRFLAGAVDPPDAMLLGGSYRGLYVDTKAGEFEDARYVHMQADLQAQMALDRFVVNGSVGYAHEGARPAAVTHGDDKNIVSRTHWVGYKLGEAESWMVRGGRMNLPFGIRSIEHTLWARRDTRTDTNTAQQHGVAISYQGGEFRGEVMGIAGNFQVNPDRYRERGYSGFVEWAAAPSFAIGASSLLAHAEADTVTNRELLRGAHGAFVRYQLIRPLVVLGEIDLLMTKLDAPSDSDMKLGHVAMLQLDFEPLQGVHVMATGETSNQGQGVGTSTGAWMSAAWFFMPHADMRLDFVQQSIATRADAVSVRTVLAQIHASL